MMQDEQIERVINVNLMAPIWITKSFLPEIIERGSGHILNTCSLLGFAGVSNMVDYCTSKAGIGMFTECLRQELRNT
jgi:short-subunit dehydrogenase